VSYLENRLLSRSQAEKERSRKRERERERDREIMYVVGESERENGEILCEREGGNGYG